MTLIVFIIYIPLCILGWSALHETDNYDSHYTVSEYTELCCSCPLGPAF